jgi:uncharacterized protein (DUF58 family)
MVVDTRDEELTEEVGQVLVEDPYSEKKLQIDTSEYAYYYAQKVKQNEQKIREIFERNNAPFLKLRTDEDYYESVIEFFRRKEKEWA